MNPQIAVAKPPIVSEEPLLAEITAFLLAVRSRSRPVVSLEDGRRALALGLAILRRLGGTRDGSGWGKVRGQRLDCRGGTGRLLLAPSPRLQLFDR